MNSKLVVITTAHHLPPPGTFGLGSQSLASAMQSLLRFCTAQKARRQTACWKWSFWRERGGTAFAGVSFKSYMSSLGRDKGRAVFRYASRRQKISFSGEDFALCCRRRKHWGCALLLMAGECSAILLLSFYLLAWGLDPVLISIMGKAPVNFSGNLIISISLLNSNFFLDQLLLW